MASRSQRVSSLSFSKTHLDQIDWDFSDLQNEGINSFHWYPATFVSAIPGSVIPLLTRPDDIVLDPFAGTSTTGIEAIRLGRRYVGIDINPIAMLISRAKLLLPTVPRLMSTLGVDLDGDLFGDAPALRQLAHPRERELRGWYHSRTFAELCDILIRIRSVRRRESRIVAQAIFSSILKTVSSQSRHWGWVCDNVKPKRHEVRYKSAFTAMRLAARKLASGVAWLLADMHRRGTDNRRATVRHRWSLHCEDTLVALDRLAANSIDLVVTSPPYYGVADYVKSQRLSFLWFDREILPVEGYGTTDFEDLRGAETGCRSHRHAKDSRAEYLDYMRRCFVGLRRVIKHGRHVCFVIGESSTRERTAIDISDLASHAGFQLEYEVSRRIRHTKRRLMARVGSERVRVYRAC